MQNFHYNIPTKIFFGKGEIKNLGENLKKLGNQVLLVYGGGSIKKNGIYDAICKELEQYEMDFIELSGVEPNPRIESVRKGVALCREHHVDVILAVGGGSTIDCSKMIASGVFYAGDPWDQVLDENKIVKALPVAVVLTLAATGSEMDGYAVISDLDKHEKWSSGNDLTKPVFAILDPEYTYSVPMKQTVSGIADIMSHTFECYFTREKGAYLQSRFCESILKTCITFADVLLKNPKDYEARANIMWASSLAINGLCSYGQEVAWSVHSIEHELSAFYDITHGVGLAILTPYWMEYVLNEDTKWRFVEYGKNVWGLEGSTDIEIAKKAIQKTKDFFINLGLPTKLSEVGIDQTYFDEMAKKAVSLNLADAFIPLTAEDVKNILIMAL